MKKTYLHYDTAKKTFAGTCRAVNRKRLEEKRLKLIKKLRAEAEIELEKEMKKKK